VIFPLQDKPDPEKDAALARHILKATRIAEIIAQQEAEGNVDEITGYGDIQPPIDNEFMRKYVAYARKKIFPTLTDEALDRIAAFFVEMRSSYSTGDSIAITARQLESLVRLSEASARVRLSQAVELWILKNYLKKVATSEDGTIDIDIVSTGIPRSRVAKQSKIYSLIQDAGAEGISWDDLVNAASDQDIEKIELEMLLNNIREEGNVYEPQRGLYRTTRGGL